MVGRAALQNALLPLVDFYMDKTKRIIGAHGTDHDKLVILGLTNGPIPIPIGRAGYVLRNDVTISTATDMDTGTIASGKDYYVYAVMDQGLEFRISLNNIAPEGYDISTSKLIGGFHTLCADVGTITNHALSGYLNKDILPASVWCLKHRAKSKDNRGLVYDNQTHIWVQIYLPSTEGSGLTSKYGATIKDTLNWYGFVDMGNISKMRLLRQGEWRSIGRNSNTGTNIAGSADPVTTGGHSDTAGRRMISDIGVEDVAGCIWQWIADVGNADSGIKQLIAGGSWDTGTNAGLNNINGLYANGSAQAFISARFCCEGI